ncbi:MAG: hypothetical protein LBD45_04705 [Bacteroidales bacterium]|jgi:hypothetical protein|nr:hypothetical protein [Bacteroidales bacterium]
MLFFAVLLVCSFLKNNEQKTLTATCVESTFRQYEGTKPNSDMELGNSLNRMLTSLYCRTCKRIFPSSHINLLSKLHQMHTYSFRRSALTISYYSVYSFYLPFSYFPSRTYYVFALREILV